MEWLNDHHLLYFWMVAKEGGISRAAEKLHLAQPTLSSQIRSRVLMAFERAERESDPVLVRKWLRFVIVGGGPTGVELAGSLAEIARDTLRNEFRSIDPAAAEIVLIDGADRVLPGYPGQLPGKAAAQLEQLGVTVRTGAMVTDVQPDRVVIRIADENETIATRTVLWAAGVQASPLGRLLAARAEVAPDPIGRVPVGSDLTVEGYPNNQWIVLAPICIVPPRNRAVMGRDLRVQLHC